MKHILLGTGCVILFLFFSGSDAAGQNIVPNGDFELQSLGLWTLEGQNNYTSLTMFDVAGIGQSSWSWKRMPGTGTGNGSLVQDVCLIGGVTYNVLVDVACVESG
jgi:hypothetical protein